MIEISYAGQRDEYELLPSSFAAAIDEIAYCESVEVRQQAALEAFDDAPDVPLRSEEVVRGGTAIFRNQSACPFRAFATHRLGISELGRTEPGIDPSTKGSLIHYALEFIWKRLASQQALLALGEAERMEMIDAAIAHAWEKSRSSPDFSIQALEKKRMRGVLNDWLNIEAVRPDFEVLETEAEYGLQLPANASRQITLNIKADRLDKDTMGHRILIDYKTGKKQSVSKWLGERMEEPQLPLYAVAANVGGDDAVALASVRSGDMGFTGLAAEDIGMPGLTACDGKRGGPDDWRQVLDDWKLHINALASEFVDGRCDVLPRDGNACMYCTLKALCRIEETGFDVDAGDAENGEGS
jgi:probable DNA repair protein